MKKLDRYEFIWKAIQVHGYKDDLREIDYKGTNYDITTIDENGIKFTENAKQYLRGYRSNASRKKRIGNPKYTFDEIKEKIIKKRGDVYDFTNVNFEKKVALSTIITLICKKCGNRLHVQLKPI